MNIFFNKSIFNINEIYIKKNNKLVYNLDKIQLLGIPYSINNFKYLLINNIVHIQLLNKKDIDFFKDLDDFFKTKFKNYKSFLNDDIITVKNIQNNFNENEINICINSLKNTDFIYYLKIITI